jgi:hypothetical protein
MVPTHVTDQNLPPDILRAKARHLCDQLPFAILSNVIVLCGIAALIWDSAPISWLPGWLTVVLAFAAARWLLLRSAWRKADTPFDIKRWLRLYAATTAVAGVLLSSASFLLPAGNITALDRKSVV